MKRERRHVSEAGVFNMGKKCTLVGIVLAGGKSSRMGRDKAFLKLEGLPRDCAVPHDPSEKTLLDRALGLLSRVVSHVYVSGRDGWGKYPGIMDSMGRIGPMGGIISAIRHTRSPCLVIPCDLPFLSPELLRRLISRREKRSPEIVMTTFARVPGRRMETLVSIYEPEALPFLEESVRNGEYGLKRAIPREARVCVEYSRESFFDFFNLNCPDDLDCLRNCLKLRGPFFAGRARRAFGGGEAARMRGKRE